jgi:hypothetical protein
MSREWGTAASVFLAAGLVASATGAVAAPALAPAAAINVTTYHYDNLRTGWNAGEPQLTPATVGGAQFKLLASVSLDEQVDAQPLLMANQTIQGQGTHDVVYIVTENNTVYALDAASGAVLLTRNLGKPVPQSALPGQCNNNGPNIGITGTPVIDAASGTLYVIAYTYPRKKQQYQLFALDLSSLADKLSPVTITAAGVLSDGSAYTFNPAVSRQRAALLLANGNVYAGFASFCDEAADQSRGWILGWRARDVGPLASNHLNNSLAASPDDFFLTSIWMSGYGPAASAAGDVYFVTGNSDYSGTTFNKRLNIAESVAQLSGNLKTVRSLYTPKGKDAGWQVLDEFDLDFGSGGVMLLPPQSGQPFNLAATAGKVGILYLLNADDLTNGEKGNKSVLDHHNMGECWCGPSYFTGSDGTGRVVTSGGNAAGLWKVITGATPKLEGEVEFPAISSGQDPGFFTSVSSNSTQAGTAVVWAVSRPVSDQDTSVSLYAFDLATGAQLFSGAAGDWPNTGGNSNIVPVSANGRVYVASNKQLAIFGLSGVPAAKLPAARKAVPAVARLAPGEHEIYGIVRRISGGLITVEKRDGREFVVEASAAERTYRMAPPAVGRGVLVRGRYDRAGMLRASVLLHAKNDRAVWPPDR